MVKKVSAKYNLFSLIPNESIAIKAMKSIILNKFASKQANEIFQVCVNAEVKELTLTETNRFAAQNNTTVVRSMVDLNSSHAILLMTRFHVQDGTRKREVM